MVLFTYKNIVDVWLSNVFCLREKKKEREREDLWRKMQDLSIKNANREGISLGKSQVGHNEI